MGVRRVGERRSCVAAPDALSVRPTRPRAEGGHPRRLTPAPPPAQCLVRRAFLATSPHQLWVADITYVPTAAGFLYLAMVLDVFNCRVIAWAMRVTLHTTVVLDALDVAAMQRRATDVLHHPDQGSP